VTSACNRHQL